MSLCNQKHIDPSTGKESTDTKNKCCFKLKVDDTNIPQSLQPTVDGLNSQIFCDNTELTESTCTKTGVTNLMSKSMKNQNAPQQLIDLLTIDEVSWCGPKKLSTWLIVVIAVSGVSLLALIIFLIKKSQAKMRIY